MHDHELITYYSFLGFDDKGLLRPLPHLIVYRLRKTPWQHRVLRLRSVRREVRIRENRALLARLTERMSTGYVCKNCGRTISLLNYDYALQTRRAKLDDGNISFARPEDFDFCLICDDCGKKLLPY